MSAPPSPLEAPDLILLAVLGPLLVAAACKKVSGRPWSDPRLLGLVLGLWPASLVVYAYAQRSEQRVSAPVRLVETVPAAKLVHRERWSQNAPRRRPIYRTKIVTTHRYDPALKTTRARTEHKQVLDRYEAYEEYVDHPEERVAYGTTGIGRRLDAATFARLAAEWGGAQPVEPGPRQGVIVAGRVFQAEWPQSPETVIPLTLTRRAELGLRLDQLQLTAPDPELVARYPRPAAEDAPRLVRAHGLALPAGLERAIGRVNVVLQEACGAQVLVFLFAAPDHGPEVAEEVLAAWGGAPGPNEVLVALGVDEGAVTWREVRAAPGQEAARAALEAALERAPDLTAPEP